VPDPALGPVEKHSGALLRTLELSEKNVETGQSVMLPY
jgi:hypothetical protein